METIDAALSLAQLAGADLTLTAGRLGLVSDALVRMRLRASVVRVWTVVAFLVFAPDGSCSVHSETVELDPRQRIFADPECVSVVIRVER